MFGSRRNRPSVIGRAAQTAGRTAVVVGTANAMTRPRGGGQVSGGGTPVDSAPTGLTDAGLAQLQKLADLHTAGILTAEEFATQKARILA